MPTVHECIVAVCAISLFPEKEMRARRFQDVPSFPFQYLLPLCMAKVLGIQYAIVGHRFGEAYIRCNPLPI